MSEDSVYRMLLRDEIPKFGSGWRFIHVTQLGHKWVVLSCNHKRAKIRHEKWVDMLAQHFQFQRKMEKVNGK